MKWINVEAMRQVEQETFSTRDISSYRAMFRAGASVAKYVAGYLKMYDYSQVVIVAGTGNNGGDGFVAAKCLHEDGYNVKVFLCCVPAKLKNDARRAWEEMNKAGVEFTVLASPEAWNDSETFDFSIFPRNAVVVDAVLGIGAISRPRGVVASAIEWINKTPQDCPKISVDVPSGLNAETGDDYGLTVRATSTITFARPKIGFSNLAACEFLGHLHVADIGFPNDLLDLITTNGFNDAELLAFPEISHFYYNTRHSDSHKFDYGHVLIIGGSENYPNAPVFTAQAAYRAGVGLVTLMGSEKSIVSAAVHAPETIVIERNEKRLEIPHSLAEAMTKNRFTTLAIGPGLGLSEASKMYLDYFLENSGSMRIVIDADALTLLAEKYWKQGWRQTSVSAEAILTPHQGEAAKLLNCTSDEIQKDRFSAVKKIAALYNAIVILKGKQTLIANPDGRVTVAYCGNPGMATAGTGDILTGLAAGLLARGLGTEQAAQFAVYLHGLAGDRAACIRGRESMIASDLLREIKF